MTMEKLLNSIKQAGAGAVQAGNPVNVMFGEVVTEDPLKVRVDQRFVLTSEFLLVPESLQHFELELQHTHAYTDASGNGTANKTTEPALEDPVVIRRGLEAGDKLLLLRMQGGQQYVILDRLVEP
jgi:hypothetical protein